MAQQSKPNKAQFLMLALASQLIPIGFAIYVALYLLQYTTFQFEYALPMMLAWGSLGAVIHYASLKRGMKFRLITTAIMAVVTVGLGFGLAQAFAIDYSNLKTCQVCGFVTLPELGKTCPVCHVKFSETDAMLEDYESLDDYRIAAQTMYFMPTAPDTSIDFFAPRVDGAPYTKDPAWKPSVRKQDILEVQAMTTGKSPQ
jgi:hypothetical protein